MTHLPYLSVYAESWVLLRVVDPWKKACYAIHSIT